MKTAYIAILFIFAAFISAAQAVELRGAPTCKDWVNDKKIELLNNRNETWYLGFLSGMAYSSGKDFLRGTELSAILAWPNNYCKEYPLDTLNDAAHGLVIELTNRKGIKFP